MIGSDSTSLAFESLIIWLDSAPSVFDSTLGAFDLKRHCAEWSVYDIKVSWERFESLRIRLLSYRSRSTFSNSSSNAPNDGNRLRPLSVWLHNNGNRLHLSSVWLLNDRIRLHPLSIRIFNYMIRLCPLSIWLFNDRLRLQPSQPLTL